MDWFNYEYLSPGHAKRRSSMTRCGTAGSGYHNSGEKCTRNAHAPAGQSQQAPCSHMEGAKMTGGGKYENATRRKEDGEPYDATMRGYRKG